MGSRGPRPAPTRLRVLHGETRPSRVNYREPQPLPGDPEPPESLSPDGRKVWDRTVARLRPTGVLTPLDADALEIYCEAVVNKRQLTALLRKSAWLIKSTRGDAVKNPLAGMQRAEAMIALRYAQEFGLTPSARTSIVVGGKSKQSGAEALLS